MSEIYAILDNRQEKKVNPLYCQDEKQPPSLYTGYIDQFSERFSEIRSTLGQARAPAAHDSEIISENQYSRA
jgi:hypothetical protein